MKRQTADVQNGYTGGYTPLGVFFAFFVSVFVFVTKIY